MTIKSAPESIGSHIRNHVLPSGMTVKAAAELAGVGRPALSNLLNGNAALSPEMAAKLGRAFGVDPQTLLDLQAQNVGASAVRSGVAASAKSYVPPFLQIKADEIASWANSIQSRTRFAVFLRTLVTSTTPTINSIDFPGNDDAQRPGWDGFVDAAEGNPWVPVGRSGWEFGTNQMPKTKADGDFAKSVAQSDAAERIDTTFVFVTPRRWDGKQAWLAEKRAEKKWKQVLAYDGSDLEQWLEQSIAGQAWLASELGLPAQGVRSLDSCWDQWSRSTTPNLSDALFADAVQTSKDIAEKTLLSSRPASLTIGADSVDEALAFLSCLLAPGVGQLGMLREKVAVFDQPNILPKLTSRSPEFIAVVTSREVEKELAPYSATLRTIIIHPKNSTTTEPHIVLEPLGHEQFRKALEAMGVEGDEAARLERESGKSLTVLRRRLSTLDAVRTPPWARDAKVVMTLKPMLFSGAWNASNEADQIIISMLADDRRYAEVEADVANLVQIEDSPVISIGRRRSLVSKIDVLFAIHRSITPVEMERFFNVAKLVLAEDDPALDLPEDDRWAANIYGRQRDISGALRKGISETLTLLAVHGDALFQRRFGIEVSAHISGIVRDLLTPLDARKLEAQAQDLPMYAEAAPEAFLSIFEDDLDAESPKALSLMRPVKPGAFGSSPRTGLLWALENLAWNPRHLMRVVRVLARLAQTALDDNLMNKPTGSLSAIFRCWMPQTGANLQQRIAALEYLVREFPGVAWPLCVEQFDGHSRMGSYSHKPRWRSDANGLGEPVGAQERNDFALNAFKLALAWPKHTARMLGDLIKTADNLAPELQQQLWAKVEAWIPSADDSERAELKEVVRVAAFSRRAHLRKDRKGKSAAHDVGRRLLELLEPTDEIPRHEWLFKKHWVEESYEEIADPEFDFKLHTDRIERLRVEALRSVLAVGGCEAILDLARRGEAWTVIGNLLPKAVAHEDELERLLAQLANEEPLSGSRLRRDIVAGLLHRVAGERRITLFDRLINDRPAEVRVDVLLQAPFERHTWDHVAKLTASEQDRYWRDVSPAAWWAADRGDDLEFAITRLVEAGRPRAAFLSAEFNLTLVPPPLLFRLVKSIGTESQELDGTYQISGYHLTEAFKLLTQSGEIPSADMAGLEFLFSEVLIGEEAGIPNLEKQMEAEPDWFVHAVAFCFKRSDDAEDPEGIKAPSPEIGTARASAAYRVLDKLRRIPGRDKFGQLDEVEMVRWVETVRAACGQLARGEIGDQMIAKVYAHAETGDDGVWPELPVRNVIEKIATAPFERGLHSALYNKRGVHWRGEGGDDERALAVRYEGWAAALEFTHPRVAKILRGMVQTYDSEARWHDREAGIRRRIES